MKFLRKHTKDEPRRHSRLGDSLSFIIVICVALVLAWVIIAFIFESYQVDGPSMQNTLHNNDRLIVWKAPVTLGKIENNPWIPGRGDIIIFHQNLAPYGEPNVKTLVKRVVGLPGDHLIIKNNKVTIYNSEHPGGFSPNNFDGQKGHPTTSTENPVYNNIHIKKGQVFVMGDNRPNSLDSRTFGPINAKQVIGKLILRDWPISDIKAF